jgi:hypothetical protein
MKYFLTIVILTLISSLGYSQTAKEIEQNVAANNKIGLQQQNQTKIKTLSLNLVGVPTNNQGALKDDFTLYKEELVSLDYNEFTETMVTKYSGLSDEKIISLLNKHQVNDSSIVNE